MKGSASEVESYDQWQRDFGARLRAQREKLGLTRQALAKLAHTEQGYIVQIERGTRSPSLKTFINLLSALGVSADDMIYGATCEEEGGDDVAEGLANNLTKFVSRKKPEEAKVLFEIVQLVSKYKNVEFAVEFME